MACFGNRPRAPARAALRLDLSFRLPAGAETEIVDPGASWAAWKPAPDSDNLSKSTIDALGPTIDDGPVLWADDVQVVLSTVSKRWAGADPPGVDLAVYLLDVAPADLLTPEPISLFVPPHVMAKSPNNPIPSKSQIAALAKAAGVDLDEVQAPLITAGELPPAAAVAADDVTETLRESPTPATRFAMPATAARFTLTSAERWALDRHRTGQSVEARAMDWGIPGATLRAWELGVREAPPMVVRSITPGEWAWLIRRRLGLSVGQFSKLFRLPQPYIAKAERGEEDPGPLVAVLRRWCRELARSYEATPAELPPGKQRTGVILVPLTIPETRPTPEPPPDLVERPANFSGVGIGNMPANGRDEHRKDTAPGLTEAAAKTRRKWKRRRR